MHYLPVLIQIILNMKYVCAFFLISRDVKSCQIMRNGNTARAICKYIEYPTVSGGSLTTTKWRVVKLRIEEAASSYGG
jgi:hypothetical protein